jgi:hypothetical protein
MYVLCMCCCTRRLAAVGKLVSATRWSRVGISLLARLSFARVGGKARQCNAKQSNGTCPQMYVLLHAPARCGGQIGVIDAAVTGGYDSYIFAGLFALRARRWQGKARQRHVPSGRVVELARCCWTVGHPQIGVTFAELTSKHLTTVLLVLVL